MNMRCFEALACGTLLFLEESNMEVRDYLQDRHEVVLYRPDNLTELLVHYLEHEDEARAIAEKGHAKASELALERRLPVFFDALTHLRPGDRAYRAFDDAEKCYADVMQYSSSLEAAQQAHVGDAIASALARFPDCPAFHSMAALHRAEGLEGMAGSDRKGAVQEILVHLRNACELAPADAVPWLNLAMTCARTAAPDIALQFYERAATAETCNLGALLMGSVTDPFYVSFAGAGHWRAASEMLKAVAARASRNARGRGNAAEASKVHAAPSIGGWRIAAAPREGQRR